METSIKIIWARYGDVPLELHALGPTASIGSFEPAVCGMRPISEKGWQQPIKAVYEMYRTTPENARCLACTSRLRKR